MSNNLTIDNALLVLENEIIDGHLVVENGIIKSICQGRTAVPHKIDAAGAHILPGFIELHTDYMEKCFMPRPKTRWPAASAMNMYDGVLALAGITTVCDSVAIGYTFDGGARKDMVESIVNAALEGEQKGTNRVQHLLHLRCELPGWETYDIFKHFRDMPNLRLVSLMDHAPGQRQFQDLQAFNNYYQGKYGFSNEEVKRFGDEQCALSEKWSPVNRSNIVSDCKERGIVIATHDDTTIEHVNEAIELGCDISEFPTTMEAAALAHKKGLQVIMGAPNVVRGGSHSGNVAAHELATSGTLDILSSDYFPASLMDAVYLLAADDRNTMDLVQSVKLITKNPADALQLHDRGTLAEGKRADFLVARKHDHTMLIEHTYAQGRRIS